MHKNACLLDILEIVQDFEADEDVLFQKLFVDGRKQVDIMFNYIDVSFRHFGSSRVTMIVCLLDELGMLRIFLAKIRTLETSQHAEIIRHLRHCPVQDSVAQHILKDRVVGCNMFATDVEASLNIDSNIGRDTQMEIEETPGSSLFSYRPIKLLALGIFIDKVAGNGDKSVSCF